MDESLWSTRNIAEYAYCPRLFYYMQVEGIFIPSTDTEKGIAVHKRVDKPNVLDKKSALSKKLDNQAAKNLLEQEPPNVIRSLTLT